MTHPIYHRNCKTWALPIGKFQNCTHQLPVGAIPMHIIMTIYLLPLGLMKCRSLKRGSHLLDYFHLLVRLRTLCILLHILLLCIGSIQLFPGAVGAVWLNVPFVSFISIFVQSDRSKGTVCRTAKYRLPCPPLCGFIRSTHTGGYVLMGTK